MSKVSCLLLAFSRLDGVSRLLTSLNPSQLESIYIAIDGPTSDEIEAIQVQLVSLVESYCTINSIRLVVWQRSENLGVAAAIISAVDWFFSNEEFGIILEDDLIIGEDFVEFVVGNRDLLDRDDEILLISGNQFDQYAQLETPRNWTTYPLIWGWATSKKKWEIMKYGIVHSRIPLFRKPFNKVENFWRVGSLRVRSRQIDTWDIPLVYFMLQNRKLCLIPDKNLVSNLGNDRFASHTALDAFPLNLPIEKLYAPFEISKQSTKQTHKYNLFLENEVFQIKKKHAFLYLYFLFFTLLSGRKNWKKLAHDLQDVELP